MFSSLQGYKVLKQEVSMNIPVRRIRHYKKEKFCGITYKTTQPAQDDLFTPTNAFHADAGMHNYLVAIRDNAEGSGPEYVANRMERALVFSTFCRNAFTDGKDPLVTSIHDKDAQINRIFIQNFGIEKAREVVREAQTKYYTAFPGGQK